MAAPPPMWRAAPRLSGLCSDEAGAYCGGHSDVLAHEYTPVPSAAVQTQYPIFGVLVESRYAFDAPEPHGVQTASVQGSPDFGNIVGTLAGFAGQAGRGVGRW